MQTKQMSILPTDVMNTWEQLFILNANNLIIQRFLKKHLGDFILLSFVSHRRAFCQF